ncbi:MAG TPA: PKD domain-containing protein [Tepidisphaeraceae bacterium]|jgi:hypothetical protein
MGQHQIFGDVFSRILGKPSTKPEHRRKPCLAEALEGRVMLALAGSGYSANLSTNPTVRKQQLLCDPSDPIAGSTSVRYDPTLVHLAGYEPGPGYDNNGFLGLVEVRPPGNGTNNTILQPLVSFLNNPQGTEMGYVQVKYKLTGKAGQLQFDPGFTGVDEAGVSGVDTHGLTFELLPGVPLTTHVPYMVYAEHAGKHGNNSGDFLEDKNHNISGPDDLSSASVTSNQRPVILSTGGPYTINEGDGITLHGVAVDPDGPSSALIYSWDLNGDNVADATGSDPVISAATLASLGLGDGPKSVSITLSVSDGDKGASAPASLTVNNVKPTASINVPSGIIINPAALTFLASDPSLADVAAGFKYTINWGDGTAAQTVNATANNGSGKTISHSYALLGTYTVTATATDKDGGVSAPVSVTISVSGAQLQPDPSEPTKNALFVYGSAGPDVIRFAKSGGGINVVLDSMNAGTFKGFTRVIAYGFAGNDDIQLFDAQAVFFGGDGNDTLIAGNFPTILVGGAGNDALTASGNSKDMLIGGLGADVLNGGSGEDVLLAGRTTYDNGSSADIKALTAILNEWSRGSSYSTSIAHITGTQSGGLNGTSLFSTSGPSQNVFDDNDVDVLVGGNGRDWMIYHSSGPGVLDQADLDGTEIGTNITI